MAAGGGPEIVHKLLAGIEPDKVKSLFEGNCRDPHYLLGAHEATLSGHKGLVVRVYRPDAVAALGGIVDIRSQGKRHRVVEIGHLLFPLRVDETAQFILENVGQPLNVDLDLLRCIGSLSHGFYS